MSGNLQVSYSLSKTVKPIGSADQFFNAVPYDYDNPNEFIGRSALDRLNELNLGGNIGIKYGSAHCAHRPLLLRSCNQPPPRFHLRATPAKSSAQTSPETEPRETSSLEPSPEPTRAKSRARVSTRSSTTTTPPAPASPHPPARRWFSAGLFTTRQLVALNGVQQAIATAPTTPLDNSGFHALDMVFSYPITLARFHEGLSLEPSVALYNVANFSNFGGFSGTLLNTAPLCRRATTGAGAAANGYLNGSNTSALQDSVRVQRGSGTFAQGSPRSTEFQLKLNF